ncbi:Laccase-1 [Colletotrichum tanaceti]|nr:Laccase-1 [Colletotrichum tanaceti]
MHQRKNVIANEFLEIFTIGKGITLDPLRTDVVAQFLRQYRHSKDDRKALQGMLKGLGTPSRPVSISSHESAYGKDLDAKMAILNYLCNTPIRFSTRQAPRLIKPNDVTPLTWAAFIIAPLEILQEWEQKVVNGELFDFEAILNNMNMQLPRLALQRDSGCCVLLGSTHGQAAHIYPWASIQQASKFSTSIRTALASIWGEQLVEEFGAEMGVKTVDVPENMITLNCLIHFWLDRSMVALEPVPEKSKTDRLVLRYRHLMDSTIQSPSTVGIPLNTHPDTVIRPFKTRFGKMANCTAVHFQTLEAIEDGHEFFVETTDPVMYPLPSLRLMQIAYNMARMITLAGAAEKDEDPSDEPPTGSAGAAVPVAMAQEDESILRSNATTGNLDYDSHPSLTHLNILNVVVRANQAVGDYWLRAIPQLACSDNENTQDIKGIVRYDPSSTSDPTGELGTYMDTYADELMSNLVPVVAIEAGQQSYDDTLTVGLQVVASQLKWTLNANTFLSDWDYPTVEQVLEGNDTYSVQQNIVQLDEANVWVHFIIQNPIGLVSRILEKKEWHHP